MPSPSGGRTPRPESHRKSAGKASASAPGASPEEKAGQVVESRGDRLPRFIEWRAPAIEDASELRVLRLESRLSQEKRGMARAGSRGSGRGRSWRAWSEGDGDHGSWSSPFEGSRGRLLDASSRPQFPVERVCSSKAWRPTSASEGASDARRWVGGGGDAGAQTRFFGSDTLAAAASAKRAQKRPLDGRSSLRPGAAGGGTDSGAANLSTAYGRDPELGRRRGLRAAFG